MDVRKGKTDKRDEAQVVELEGGKLKEGKDPKCTLQDSSCIWKN